MLRWYLDTSVLLRVIVEQSPSARVWYLAARARGDQFISSRLLELEAKRNAGRAGVDPQIVDAYLSDIAFVPLSDAILDDALKIAGHLRSADALHLASAQRVGADLLTVVTHDRQMADAAVALGFDVLDPVVDDPGHTAVTVDL